MAEIMKNKEAITVFKPVIARKLLKDGYKLIDIRPDKTDFNKQRSLFVFKNEDGLMNKIKEYKGFPDYMLQ